MNSQGQWVKLGGRTVGQIRVFPETYAQVALATQGSTRLLTFAHFSFLGSKSLT